jgi:hypothetical protein
MAQEENLTEFPIRSRHNSRAQEPPACIPAREKDAQNALSASLLRREFPLGEKFC